MRKFRADRVFRMFSLHKTIFPGQTYFYSPRLKRRPYFTGDLKLLSSIDAHILENICPTNAIKVSKSDIFIDPRGCITCGLCIEASPPGLLEVSRELSFPEEKKPQEPKIS